MRNLSQGRLSGLAALSITLIPCLSSADAPIDREAIDNWRSFELATFTTDAQWVATLSRPSASMRELLEEGPEKAVALYPALEDELGKQYRLEISRQSGAGSYELLSGEEFLAPQFSRDGTWFAVLRKPADDEGGESAEPDGADAESGGGEDGARELVLLDLRSGEQSMFAGVAEFLMGGDHLFLATSGETRLLMAIALKDGAVRHLGPVSEFAVNSTESMIAWTVSSAEGYGNGVFVAATDSLSVRRIGADTTLYDDLSWTDEGDALTVLKIARADDDDSDDDDELEPLVGIFAASGLGGRQSRAFDIDASTPGVGAGLNVNRHPFDYRVARAAQWNDERTAVIFSLVERDTKDEGAAEEDGGPAGDDDYPYPNLGLWHWRQVEIPNQDGPGEERHDRRAYPSLYWIDDGTVVRLADENDPEELTVLASPTEISSRNRYAFATLGADSLLREIKGSARSDVYRIDVKTGRKDKILDQVNAFDGDISGDGRFVTFFRDGDHYLYDIGSAASVNLTEELSVSFLTRADDDQNGAPAHMPEWTASGNLLVRDNWDIWMLPNPSLSDRRELVKLTPDGAQAMRIYTPLVTKRLLSPADVFLGQDEPDFSAAKEQRPDEFIVFVQDVLSLTNGYGRVDVEAAAFDWLRPLSPTSLRGNDLYSPLPYVESAEGRRFLVRESMRERTRVELTDGNLKPVGTLFEDDWNSTPLRRKYAKPAGVRVFDYACTWGERLPASIVLPAGFRKGRTYPTVVIVYESGFLGMAGSATAYMEPEMEASVPMDLASRGYAVLLADVGFQLGNPGISSLQCLMPALDAAVGTGIVDPDRIGLHGHSWGGYQTLFHTTQTDRFAAAIAGAGLSDLVSMYGGVYWGNLSAQQPLLERGQGRMVDSIWEDWQGYLDNSPLYHAEKLNTPLLILHNESDQAVGFYQGHQYFLALRKLQKPAVLLQYRGDGHGVESRVDRMDYRSRHLEFWGHHLKGEAAPEWWSEGIKPDDMQEHLEGRYPELGPPAE